MLPRTQLLFLGKRELPDRVRRCWQQGPS